MRNLGVIVAVLIPRRIPPYRGEQSAQPVIDRRFSSVKLMGSRRPHGGISILGNRR